MRPIGFLAPALLAFTGVVVVVLETVLEAVDFVIIIGEVVVAVEAVLEALDDSSRRGGSSRGI